MTWSAKLSWSGSPSELAYMFGSTDLGTSITEADQQLVMGLSPRSEDPDDPKVEATERLRVIHGMCVARQVSGRFSIHGIQRSNGTQAPTQYIYVESITSTQYGYPDGEQWLTSCFLAASQRNPCVNEALGYLGEIQGDDWGNLSKVIELLHHNKAPLQEWGMSKTIRQIKAVANSPETAGRNARHAVQKGSPTKPVPFETALVTVIRALEYWVQLESIA